MSGTAQFIHRSKISYPKHRCRYVAITAIAMFMVIALAFANTAIACDWCHRKANIYVFCEEQYRAEATALAQGLFDVINTDCFTIGYYSENKIEYAFSLAFYTDSVYGSKCDVNLWYVGGQVKDNAPTNIKPKLGYGVKNWLTAIESFVVADHLEPMKNAISQSPPMHEIAWDWEGTPVSLEMETSEICIDPEGFNYDFFLKDVRLHNGQTCSPKTIRDINRFVFEIEASGRIEWDVSEKITDGKYASLHYKCDQKFVLTRPGKEDQTFNEIKITAYNSCEILKKEVKPLTETEQKDEIGHIVVRNEWRLPKYCEIELDENGVEAGANATITIKKIQDAMAFDSQPYDRLFVKVKEGKITNGKSLGGMKAFDVGKGVIKVRYQAPDDCELKEDVITVYSSCSTSDSSAVEPGEEMKTKKFDIYCNYTWSGSMTVETIEHFDCTHTEESGNASRVINYKTERIQRAMISIQADNILPDDDIADLRAASDWNVTGDLKSMLDDYYSVESKHKKQDANLFEETRTTIDELLMLKSDNVSILIARDPGDLEATAKEIQQMAMEAMASGGDEKALEAAMNRINEMYSIGEKSVPIRFVVQIGGELIGSIHMYRYRVVDDSVEINDDYTDQGPAALPMTVEFKGTLTRDKEGHGTLTGSISDIDDGPAGTVFECPDRRYTHNVYLNLNERRKKEEE